jgi:hypothetical protein
MAKQFNVVKKDKGYPLLALLLLFLLPGLGIPTAVTWALSGALSTWTPLSVLCLIGVIVLWLAGIAWSVFWTVGYFVMKGD